jgi:hypothetical protein
MNMKHIIYALLIGLYGVSNAQSMTNYFFDIELLDSGETYSLRLDSTGHAKREYDAFVKYATEYEANDSVRATKWEDRGIGIFIEVAATPDDQGIALSLSFEKAEFLGLTTHDVQGHKVMQPTFGSQNTTTEIRVWLGQWVDFSVIKFRIRKEDPQQAGPGYPPQGVGSPDP